MAAQTDLQFDGWTVNRVSGEISRADRSSRLPQQPLRILLELFDHAGEVVTREHLVKVLWPAGVVDFDNGLNVAVRKLRVALDDVGDVPRYIETLPRVGYRFIGRRGGAAVESSAVRRMPSRARIALALGVAGLAIALALGWWGNSGAGHELAVERHHVPSGRARDLYLEGLSLRSRRDIDTGQMAREKFEAAIREDPEYAQAWAALAGQTSASVIRQTLKPEEGIRQARAAAERAVELDDGLVEGHMALASILMDHFKDFAGAKREFDRALAINDQVARLWHHYGMWQGQLGHMQEAIESLRRARELEPMTLLYGANYAMLLYEARRYDEVVAFLRPVVEANPKFDQARSVLGRALMMSGDLAGAQEQFLARDSPGAYQGDLGVLYAKKGQRDEALKYIQGLAMRGKEGYAVAYDQALIYTALGDLDRGCEYLLRATRDHSILVNWMRLEPVLDPLRGRKCFADADRLLYGEKAPDG